MGMFDTVVHDGLEWQTRSIEPGLGGTMDDYEVKDSRLWLKPYHLEDTEEEVPAPPAEAGIVDIMESFHAGSRRVDDPPVDAVFHGVIDLYRTTSGGAHGPCCYEYRRLVFVFGQLVSESPITEEAERTDGRGLAGDWMPSDPQQRMAWQLQTLQGLVSGIAADPAMQAPEAAASLEALKQAEVAVSKAIATWPSQS